MEGRTSIYLFIKCYILDIGFCYDFAVKNYEKAPLKETNTIRLWAHE